MNIGILGSGAVGQTLGAGFISQGHQVKIGTRSTEAEPIKNWIGDKGAGASAGSAAEAATFGELIVLATNWSGTENAIQLAGAENFKDKTVIDVTNPVAIGEDGSFGLTHGHTDSGGEQVQRWLPDSHVVKAFNSVFVEHMVNPEFSGGPPDLFICGNDAGAKGTVTELAEGLGWSVFDTGPIASARALEPLLLVLAPIWLATGSREFALKLLWK